MSEGQATVSNTVSTQLHIMFLTAIMGIFTLFNANLYAVKLTCDIFPPLLPLGSFSFPDGQVVVVMVIKIPDP